ncbi:MAG: glycoside hydrolase family 78 protein [Lentisphaeria bacterium]|nr:glycoside hydrolase family 78 protein [Lentisphaeria bacterium]
MISICGLKVENLEFPLGIAEERPRFSWHLESAEPGLFQTSYRLVIQEEGGDWQWDSGVIESDASLNIEGCPRLKPCSRYCWKVIVSATSREHDRLEAAAESWFETGKLNQHWDALWIAGIHNGETHQPVNCLRKTFTLTKSVARARLYATALGCYDCAINGEPVSDESLAPGWTDYYFRVQHQTYDVTALLRQGTNAIGARLGDGWYCGSIARRRNSNRPSYGSIPVFRAELHILYMDGTQECVLTDRSWRCSIGSPLRFSDIYDGELYDSRFVLGDWTKGDYPAQGWSPCLAKNRRVAIVGRTAPPVRPTEELAPVQVRDIDPGLWKREPNIPDPHRLTIIDFGQNLVGRIRLRIRLPQDASISIRHGEMLLKDGSLFLGNLRSARAAITLIGNGEWFDYEPSFSFFGFRYLQITNLPDDFDPQTLRVRVLHTDLQRTGWFQCSDPLLNRLYLNQLWSNRSNYLDVPTDCNQRDERLGWLGDAWIFADTATYNFNAGAFLAKYLEEVNLSRTAEGEYPQYAPFFAVSHLDADYYGTDYYKGHNGWAEGAIIIPWILYRKYNDRRILARHYDRMLAWIRYQETNSDHLLRRSCVWRDWLNHDDPTSETLISTAFFAYGTSLMARIAAVLGKTEDAEELQALFQNIRSACQRHFMKDGRLGETSQTAALLTLAFDLAPQDMRPAILEQLTANIAKRGDRLSTGFLGTPFLLPILAGEGQDDLACRLLFQQAFPSWLYPVLQGATTIWERWDGYTVENGILAQPMNSFNHYAYGAVASYLYAHIGGIRITDKDSDIGFRHFLIAPVFAEQLSWAETTFDSPCGRIRTRWDREDDGSVTLEAVIPSNTTATLILPDRPEQELEPGAHRFTCSPMRK